MKKILATLVVTLVCLQAFAQPGLDPRFFNNKFFSFGGGANLTMADAGMGTSFAADVTYGNWVMSDLALRASFSALGSDKTSLFIHGDVLWDALSTLTQDFDAKRVVSVYPLAGVGAVYTPDSALKLDAGMILGANVEFRIPSMREWPLFVEAKCFFMPEGFRGNVEASQMISVVAGMKHEIRFDPHHRALYGESHSWASDWFVGVGLGANYSLFTQGVEVDYPDLTPLQRIGWQSDLTIGRNLSSMWTLRLGLGTFSCTNVKTDYMFYNLRADLLFNVSNIHGFDRGRRFNIMPYLGGGYVERFDLKQFLAEIDGGVFFRYYLNKHIDFYADARYNFYAPRFLSDTEGQTDFSVATPMLHFGVLYNFEPSTSRYAGATGRLRN